MSGQIRRPRCSKSSPTLTTIVVAPGEAIRSNPKASFAPPTPPHSATIFFPLRGDNALRLPVRSSEQVLTCGTDQRCRGQGIGAAFKSPQDDHRPSFVRL